MSLPLFPELKPRLIDASWFEVDGPVDDEDEVSTLEKEHQQWVKIYWWLYFLKFLTNLCFSST